MRDNEIIKALECCSDDEPHFCSVCPYYLQDKENDYCREDMNKDSLSLINRQKAEIERLQAEVDNVNHDYILLCSDVAENRAEAIKEFAERLKREKRDLFCIENIDGLIDNLVKEMVGDTNG